MFHYSLLSDKAYRPTDKITAVACTSLAQCYVASMNIHSRQQLMRPETWFLRTFDRLN